MEPPAPPAAPGPSPLTAEQQLSTFSLPPGFQLELIASESEGIGKFVAVDWDLKGNLWTMTALDYPVDANENPAEAKALFSGKGRDKVLVFERDPNSPTGYRRQPRVFADGLAIPLGLLPFKEGVYVQHGPNIVFLSDTNGSGIANNRQVMLSGFGVQDSHLFPHQFTRAPGNWIWLAQGAFNYGKVRGSDGQERQFDQTRMARFRYEGSEFDITSQGPCNIWGLFINAEGEAWIQEANDYGYPAMPFHLYANYPGCSDGQFKSYAPEFPGTAPDFKMGGTGLSGLALSDLANWPKAYADVMYVANPITRKIQAIRIHRDGPRYRLHYLGDFLRSSDEWFRPVALRLGPDGCLYLVDWYNKIISHNEVPRNHPERDKSRGRIWRVKHQNQKMFPIEDLAKLAGDDLIAKLGGESLVQHHLAWQAIGDRRLNELAPKLKAVAADKTQSSARRIGALWALEALDALRMTPAQTVPGENLTLLTQMLADSNRNVRRESLRALGQIVTPLNSRPVLAALTARADDADPEVRAEVIRSAAQIMKVASAAQDSAGAAATLDAIGLLAHMARAPLDSPVTKSTHNGKTIKTGVAYEREFERYLVRLFLERSPDLVSRFLDSSAAENLPLENRLLATLALPPKDGAARLAELLPRLERALLDEEMLRLAQFSDLPGPGEALQKILQRPATRSAALATLLKFRAQFDSAKLNSSLTQAARDLLATQNPESLELGARVAAAFKLSSLDHELAALLQQDGSAPQKLSAQSFAALRALREIGSVRADLFEALARSLSEPAQRNDAIAALTASKAPDAGERLLKLWPDLTLPQRRAALGNLAGNKPGAQLVLGAVKSGAIAKTDLHGSTLDKLQTVLGHNPELDALLAEMDPFLQTVLRLDGKNESYLDIKLTLAGAFTVETWLKLDEGISNLDGILASPGVLDLNFSDAQFRVWAGPLLGDVLIAKYKTVPGVWTHYAVTRDEHGIFSIFVNGELDGISRVPCTNTLHKLDVGRTIPTSGGTAGELSEFRVWQGARTPAEIRAAFDRSLGDRPRPASLIAWFGGKEWKPLHGGAKVERTDDFPALLTAAEAKAQEEKFAKFRALVSRPGNVPHGLVLFTNNCAACHTVGGVGAQIGPVLNGAGAMGMEGLLRAILTPNAAMEAGYRTFRVELRDGEVVDGLLVKQDEHAIILRRPNAEDLRLPLSTVRRAAHTKISMMPEGLLEGMPAEDITDLFAYLQTLK